MEEYYVKGHSLFSSVRVVEDFVMIQDHEEGEKGEKFLKSPYFSSFMGGGIGKYCQDR